MRMDKTAIRKHARKDKTAVGQTVPGDKELVAYLTAVGCENASDFIDAVRSGDENATSILWGFLDALGDPNAAQDANAKEFVDA